MGRHARLRAEEYGWDRVAQRVLSYYERLLYERGLTQQSRARRTEDTAPVRAGV
jgi:hypothetical protein